MAIYRGQEGSATWATVGIPQMRSWSMESTMPVVDQTVKGDLHGKFRGGVPVGTSNITGLYDNITAQSTLIALHATATPSQVSAALVLTAASGKTFTVQAILTGWTVTSPEGNADVTINFNFQHNGAITVV